MLGAQAALCCLREKGDEDTQKIPTHAQAHGEIGACAYLHRICVIPQLARDNSDILFQRQKVLLIAIGGNGRISLCLWPGNTSRSSVWFGLCCNFALDPSIPQLGVMQEKYLVGRDLQLAVPQRDRLMYHFEFWRKEYSASAKEYIRKKTFTLGSVFSRAFVIFKCTEHGSQTRSWANVCVAEDYTHTDDMLLRLGRNNQRASRVERLQQDSW